MIGRFIAENRYDKKLELSNMMELANIVRSEV